MRERNGPQSTNVPEFDSVFQSACELFNHQQFFECHEVLEELWGPLPPGPEKTFLQGLIQIAVGFHHLQRLNYVGAKNKLQSGLEKLETSCNPGHWQPPFQTDVFIRQNRLALQEVLRLGPEALQNFPADLMPRILPP